MITSAEILDINVMNNLCRVRIPILEGVGNKTKVELWANMILPPGTHSGYKKGDIVFVSFADNSLGKPVVLGQMYRGPYQSTQTIDQAEEISCLKLEVAGEAVLPLDVKFCEPNSREAVKEGYSNLESIFKALDDLTSRIVNLERDLEALRDSSN